MNLLPYDVYASITRVLGRERPWTMVDVGANQGQTARRLSEEFPNATIYAFEPAPETFEKLRENTGALAGVRPVQLAAGSATGTIKFHVAGNPLCSSVLAPSDLGKRLYGDWYDVRETIEVPMVRLDDWARENNIESIDFLKVDAQGYDLEVLKGASGLLESGCVAVTAECPFVQEYAGGCTFAQIDAFLSSRGFALHQIFAVHEHGNEQQSAYAEVLWLAQEVLEKLRARKDLPDLSAHGRMYRAIDECRKSGSTRVALYGAGQHTRRLETHLSAMPLPVVAIIDDNPALRGQVVAGRPVVTTSDAIKLGIDAAILSSDAHEPALWASSKPLRDAGITVVPLYNTRVGTQLKPAADQTPPQRAFHDPHYQRLNQRRLEHLASLNLPLTNRRVLEVGAGVGDLTGFFLDRGCLVHATDARLEHLTIIADAHRGREGLSTARLDLDAPPEFRGQPFDVVFCYGVLYHLRNPEACVRYIAQACSDMVLLETCVSHGENLAVNHVQELASNHAQAASGLGCRPTRRWVMEELRKHLPFVYTTTTQPAHAEFPCEWNVPNTQAVLSRAIFIASRKALKHPMLTETLPDTQTI